MKGLTPKEFKTLEEFKTEESEYEPSDEELAVLADLTEQGRLRHYFTPVDDDMQIESWDLTAAGREALRIWPAIRAALGCP